MDNQRNRLVEQLEFEKSKDFLPKVEKWSKAVSDDEEELQKLQAEEKRQMEVFSTQKKLQNLHFFATMSQDNYAWILSQSCYIKTF